MLEIHHIGGITIVRYVIRSRGCYRPNITWQEARVHFRRLRNAALVAQEYGVSTEWVKKVCADIFERFNDPTIRHTVRRQW